MSNTPDFPPNPFTPGTAHPPPYFAGRRDVLDDFLAVAGQLDEPAKPRGQVVVGPRGYGKTVLLRKFANAVGNRCPNVRLIHTRASKINTIENLIAVVVRHETGGHVTVESVGINILGSGGEVSTSQTISAGVAVEAALGRLPTILVVDEAGELQGESGHVLLNAVESLMETKRPIMVMLAGTPKIYAAFESAKVTFRERFDKKGLPLLDDLDSRAAIAEPMRANGMRIDDDALDCIVKDSIGYPYFLQTWGRQVYDAAVDQETRAIDEEIVRQAHHGVRIAQEELYEGRLKELRKDRDVTAAAIRIARSFVNDGGDSRSYRDLDDFVVEALASAGKPPDRAANIIERLHEVGFVWQITRDTADNWEAGIPSLMGYTLARQGDGLARKPQGLAR